MKEKYRIESLSGRVIERRRRTSSSSILFRLLIRNFYPVSGGISGATLYLVGNSLG